MAEHLREWLAGYRLGTDGGQVDDDGGILDLIKTEPRASTSHPNDLPVSGETKVFPDRPQSYQCYSENCDAYPVTAGTYSNFPGSHSYSLPATSSTVGGDRGPTNFDKTCGNQEEHFMQQRLMSQYNTLPFQYHESHQQNLDGSYLGVYSSGANHGAGPPSSFTNSYPNRSFTQGDKSGFETGNYQNAGTPVQKYEHVQVSGVKREYADEFDCSLNNETAMKRPMMDESMGHNLKYEHCEGYQDPSINQYNYYGATPGYGFSESPQQWSHQQQWENDIQYQQQNIVPNPTPKAKSKRRTHTIDPNAERIRQENMKIEKYIRTFEPVGSIADTFIHIEGQLNKVLNQIQFVEPVTHVYNPTTYAHEPHEDYIRKYCNTKKEILFIGMNPGPFGMAQNGVPFGEVKLVKDWLKIEGHVTKPEIEHPQRPILGLDCTRSEVSGSRFWGMFRRVCGTADQFFRHSFVHNYCPLALMSKTGKNITPPQLAKAHSGILMESCDRALCDIVKLLGVRVLIGIGKYAQERARSALKIYEPDLQVDVRTLLHPSPINPSANKGWEPVAEKQLLEMGVYHMIAVDNQVLDNQKTLTDLSKSSGGGTCTVSHYFPAVQDTKNAYVTSPTDLSESSDLSLTKQQPTEVCKSPFDDA